ncbi:unnamed protein product [Closterium sp. NIES-54]
MHATAQFLSNPLSLSISPTPLSPYLPHAAPLVIFSRTPLFLPLAGEAVWVLHALAAAPARLPIPAQRLSHRPHARCVGWWLLRILKSNSCPTALSPTTCTVRWLVVVMVSVLEMSVWCK